MERERGLLDLASASDMRAEKSISLPARHDEAYLMQWAAFTNWLCVDEGGLKSERCPAPLDDGDDDRVHYSPRRGGLPSHPHPLNDNEACRRQQV